MRATALCARCRANQAGRTKRETTALIAHARGWAVPWAVPWGRAWGRAWGLGRALGRAWPGGRWGAIVAGAGPTCEAHGLASRADHQDVLRRDLREHGTRARRRCARACMRAGYGKLRARQHTSSFNGDATRCLLQRLRIATATARLASGCPMMYRSSCSTISFGRSAFSSATSAVSSSELAAAAPSMVTFTSGCAAALWHIRTRWSARPEGRRPLATIRLDMVESMAENTEACSQAEPSRRFSPRWDREITGHPFRADKSVT